MKKKLFFISNKEMEEKRGGKHGGVFLNKVLNFALLKIDNFFFCLLLAEKYRESSE